MAKKKTVFFCDECGHESAQWLGRCPQCQEWNTFKEMTLVPSKKMDKETAAEKKEAIKNLKPLAQVDVEDKDRISLGSSELDRVFGGGVVPHTTILFAGEPGIGKSTLLLQVCNFAAENSGKSVLYISAEESIEQVRRRSVRLGLNSDNLYVVAETDVDLIEEYIKKVKPGLMVLDSIQAVQDNSLPSSAGTVTQVREVSGRLGQIAKDKGFVLFLIGHVTKDGTLAGPRMLEHMVDVVTYFEGDRYESLRMVRSVKNRYGATGEVGIFEMREDGLHEKILPVFFFLMKIHYRRVVRRLLLWKADVRF